MSAHTPGPWAWKEAGKRCSLVGSDGTVILTAEGENGTPADDDVIAAAPDLLKALQGMCSVWVTVCNSKGWEPDHVIQYSAARAAIAKATGSAA